MRFERSLVTSSEKLTQLVESGVLSQYAVIGAIAVARVAVPRATADIDIAIKLGSDSLELLAERVGGMPHLGDIHDPLIGSVSFNVRDTPIQLIQFPLGIERVVFSDFETYEIASSPIPFASWRSLLILKLYAGSPLDLQDAKYILEMNLSDEEEYEELYRTAQRLRISKRLEKLR